MNDSVITDVKNAEALAGIDRSKRGILSAVFMIADKFFYIDIRDTVSISQQKRFISNVFADALDPPAGHRSITGIHDRDPPRFSHIAVDLRGVAHREIKGDITAVQIVVRKVFLDHVLLVTGADNEFRDPIGPKNFHNMPQNGLPTDLNHGLRPQMTLFRNSGSESTR